MKVVWSQPAVRDLDAIREYVARDSAHYAARLVARIIDAVRLLRRFPEMGAVVPEFREAGIRERVSGNYRILYQVCSTRVLIVAVVHAARDIGSIHITSE